MRSDRLKEINVIRKTSHNTQWRIGLVYPNTYSVGMSGFTIKLLYHLLNQHQNIYTERIFFSADFPGPPRSVETGKTLSQFDLLAFTFQFELDYINAIKMLQRSKIPVFVKDRAPNHPLILAGGPAITANPEPLLDFFNIIFLGEFELISKNFLEAITQNKHGNLIDTILTVPGFHSSQDQFHQADPLITENLDNVDYPTAQVRPINDRRRKKGLLSGFFLQVSRGCPHGCHFCMIRKIFRPPRERSLDTLKNLINIGSVETKTDFISLIGSSTADHSQINELLEFISKKELKFTLPSIRIDSGLDILTLIKKTGQKSLSIAPETASDDLRFKIGKKITNSQIFNFLREANQAKIRLLKLYFILGISSVASSESREIAEFVNNMSEKFPLIQFSVSITPFVPKRNTKLSSHCVDYNEIKAGFHFLRHNLNKKVRYKLFPAHWAAVQAIVSNGGRELSNKIVRIAEKGGSFQIWKKSLEEDPSAYYLKHYCQ
ncbi:MAG: B12-binding domain-containing radical SAM protein [Candidatus Hodarchaeales archaeon]|jgi:radical SAM superfamily enzyme YgiQ (UPF0313 family)